MIPMPTFSIKVKKRAQLVKKTITQAFVDFRFLITLSAIYVMQAR